MCEVYGLLSPAGGPQIFAAALHGKRQDLVATVLNQPLRSPAPRSPSRHSAAANYHIRGPLPARSEHPQKSFFHFFLASAGSPSLPRDPVHTGRRNIG